MLDPTIYHENLTLEQAHAQVVYLYHVLGYAPKKISEITQYAVSTIRRYKDEFIELLDKAKKWFGEKIKAAEAMLMPKIDRISSNVEIINNTPCAYVVALKNVYDEIVWIKVGETEKDIIERCKGHLSTKTYKENGVVSVEIKQVYYTNNEDDALTIENELRKAYKEKYPSTFIAKDRFAIKEIIKELPQRFYSMCKLLDIETAPAI